MTNYCTFFPESVFGHDISGCCKAHDIAYTIGSDKEQADVELFKCVREHGYGMEAVGTMMFVAVSVFGIFFYKNK
ncbi:hypothetical protein D3C86_1163890 [compost metagenome]